MGDLINFNQMGIVDPDERLKQLVNAGSTVSVEAHMPILRYYRSGHELYRMAKVYLSEGNFENAYILLMRFLTIFIEQIKKHPQFPDQVPVETKKSISSKVKEIMPITENLKQKLKARYKKEYEQYLIDQEHERKRALEEAKRKELEDAKSRSASKTVPSNIPSAFLPSAPDMSDLDKIVYPNDFPNTDPQKSSGLLPGTKPSFDRTAKPSASLMEDRLRMIKIPSDINSKFLEVARQNTLKNIELCGLLTGKLEQDQLIVTHLIVPKQSGTSDTCDTRNEEEIWAVQDEKNLNTFGWIHTHPTQTAFLSSVDLHTQAGYQNMLNEAIAIVCAPKFDQEDIYRLTSDGLNSILKCTERGFHTHPPNQFIDAEHYILDKTRKIEIIDLR